MTPWFIFPQGGGGGGVLSLEKGTNCGPTAGELWLLRHAKAKRRNVLVLYCKIGELSDSVQPIFYIKYYCMHSNVFFYPLETMIR